MSDRCLSGLAWELDEQSWPQAAYAMLVILLVAFVCQVARVTLRRPSAGLACTEAAASLARSSLSAHHRTGKHIQNGCDIVASHGSYVF
jgi:hypothetical protein